MKKDSFKLIIMSVAVICIVIAGIMELGPHNICVNAVCPGFVVTDLNRGNSNKVSYAMQMSVVTTEFAVQDLVNFITFFCSDLIKGVSGRVFNLDSRIM